MTIRVMGPSASEHGAELGLRVPLWITAGVCALLAGLLLRPLYALAALLSVSFLVGSFVFPVIGVFGIGSFIVSPFSLYFDRAQSTLIVFLLLAGFFYTSILRGATKAGSHVGTTIGRIALIFVSYMIINCAWAIYRGNDLKEAVNELVPILEMWAGFWLAARTSFSQRATRALMVLFLALVAARGAWQLVLFFTGHSDALVPPVYDVADWNSAAYYLPSFWFIRLIDPVAGLHVAIAFAVLLACGSQKLRQVSAVALGVCATVSILGLTRAEWLATIACVVLVLYALRGKISIPFLRPTIAILALGLSVVILGDFFQTLSLNLGSILEMRFLDYTKEQIFDPRSSLQSLRLLEFATVKSAFLSAPVFGHGLGRELGTVVFDGVSYRYIPLHNYLFNILANTGIVGLGLLALLLKRVAKGVIALFRRVESHLELCLVLCAGIGILWYGIFLNFHPVFSAYHIPALLGIYLGAAVSLTAQKRHRLIDQSPPREPTRHRQQDKLL